MYDASLAFDNGSRSWRVSLDGPAGTILCGWFNRKQDAEKAARLFREAYAVEPHLGVS